MNSEQSLFLGKSMRLPCDDHLQRLFDRFFRADPSRKNHGQGVGLGLTIARSLLHMNGAKLTVSSDDNLTVFAVLFHK